MLFRSGPNIQDKIRVIVNDKNVTNDPKTQIDATCYSEDGTKVSCNSLVNGNAYSIDVKVTYGQYGGRKTIMIKKSC